VFWHYLGLAKYFIRAKEICRGVTRIAFPPAIIFWPIVTTTCVCFSGLAGRPCGASKAAALLVLHFLLCRPSGLCRDDLIGTPVGGSRSALRARFARVPGSRSGLEFGVWDLEFQWVSVNCQHSVLSTQSSVLSPQSSLSVRSAGQLFFPPPTWDFSIPRYFSLRAISRASADAVEIIHHADHRHRVHDVLVGESMSSELLEILL